MYEVFLYKYQNVVEKQFWVIRADNNDGLRQQQQTQMAINHYWLPKNSCRNVILDAFVDFVKEGCWL